MLINTIPAFKEFTPFLAGETRGRMRSGVANAFPHDEMSEGGGAKDAADVQGSADTVSINITNGLFLSEGVNYYNLGASLAGEGRHEEAVEAYKQAIPFIPRSARLYHDLGISYTCLGRYDEAIRAYYKSLHHDSNNPTIGHDLGVCLAARGDHEKAIQFFRMSIDWARPCSSSVYTDLGISLAHLGRHKEAGEAFRESLHHNPNDATVHCKLGFSLAVLGRHEEAIGALREALRLDPKDAIAHFNLGYSLGKQGRHEEAIGALREALRLDPNSALAHDNLGFSLSGLGRHEEAIGALREALRLDPTSANVYIGLGFSLAELGRHEEAMGAYREALRLDPKCALAHYNLGVALADLDRHEQAIEAFREALRCDPKCADAHLAHGEILFKQGNDDWAALDHLNRAVSLNPTSSEAFYWRALALARQGKTDEASRDLRRAGKLNPDAELAAKIQAEQERLALPPEAKKTDKVSSLELIQKLGDGGSKTLAISLYKKHGEQQIRQVVRLLSKSKEADGTLRTYNFLQAPLADAMHRKKVSQRDLATMLNLDLSEVKILLEHKILTDELLKKLKAQDVRKNLRNHFPETPHQWAATLLAHESLGLTSEKREIFWRAIQHLSDAFSKKG